MELNLMVELSQSWVWILSMCVLRAKRHKTKSLGKEKWVWNFNYPSGINEKKKWLTWNW